MKPKKFASKIKPAVSGCWEWKGHIHHRTGYGCVKINYRQIAAHRVSWTLINGLIPDGLYVCHKCDNKNCVRPSHLFLGTQKDNIQDMIRKGRRVKEPQGEQSRLAKLTTAQVLEIRALHKGGMTQDKISQLFGTTQSNINTIIKRRSWTTI